MKKENIKRKKTAQAPLEISNFKRRQSNNKSLTGQDIQDEIFRKMSADRKLEIASQLWQLAKDLVGNKIYYETRRSKTSFSQGR